MSKGKTDEDLSFEQAIEELESIVGQMESGTMPLDKLITSYEDGSRYLKVCSARLAEAEKKIEILKKKGENPVFEDFDPDNK
ncbi:exodeoxyribonuclease VII small subunit [Puniceicoccaceae bacterium K14]|nr:exodeoxyribonuclease VII small subunit [Puniceicoccaceae bacterium K14]